MPVFTETEKRVLAVLRDGKPHGKQELMNAVDEEADMSNVHKHLHCIRTKIRPIGQDIVAQLLYRKIYYRHVRLLCPDDD
ncbi:MAG: hypothetical protein ACRC7O_04455 [Fimbriiglobus sp.]